MTLMKYLVFITLTLGIQCVHAMGKQPVPEVADTQGFAKMCSTAAQKKFKAKYPKDKITKVTYSVDKKNKTITYVTIYADDGNGCNHSSPAIVACYDFGNSASAKCVSGKLVEFND